MRRSGFQRAKRNRMPSRMSSTPPRIEPRGLGPLLTRSSRDGMTFSRRHRFRHLQNSGYDQQKRPQFAEAVSAVLRHQKNHAHGDDHDRAEQGPNPAIRAMAYRTIGLYVL